MTPEPLLTVKEVAPILRLAEATVYELAKQGVLPCVHIGRAIRFDPAKLRDYVNAGGSAFDGGWKKGP